MSLMLSVLAGTHFSLAISEATATLCPNESTRQTWKHCLWWFLSRQLLSFRWCFPSQQGCVRERIKASDSEAVSLMVYESAGTLFSLAILESTWTLWDDESTRQLSKQCRWWFLSPSLLSFHWRFSSQQGLCARTNLGFSSGGSLVDAFRVGSDLFFACDFRGNLDFVPWWIHASDLEALSLMVSESAATQLSVMIPSQEGLFAQMKPSISWGSSCDDNFRVGSDSDFGDNFWVKWDCVRWRIQTSAREAVSLIVSESVTT
jgi:hypothetical protein